MIPTARPLAELAVDFPDLSWAEAYTAAKLIGNGTGWHVGAMVGSPDFIADMGEVKGKTDAGIVAPMAAGALASLENDQDSIAEYRTMYRTRLDLLSALMRDCGMKLAIEARAGFYTLWKSPTRAFGWSIVGAEGFQLRDDRQYRRGRGAFRRLSALRGLRRCRRHGR